MTLPTLVDGRTTSTNSSSGRSRAATSSYPRSAYDDVTLSQLLTYSFVTPVVKRGLRSPLQQEDVEEVS